MSAARRTGTVRTTAAAALVLLTGACSGGLPDPIAPPAESRIDVDTPELRAAKADLGIDPCPAAGGLSDLPDVTLPCLGGGREVTLASVPGPAVVNLWASWCGPCKKELPLLARLHREAGDRLTVLGVDYQDAFPEAAVELLASSEATYAQLADPGGSLADVLRIRGMPGTLYVDADGVATFVNLPFHDYDELLGLVTEHTGVRLVAR